MMPECDLDDNDPLSAYLKRAPMMGVKKNATNKTASSCICCLGVPLHDRKFDSISIGRGRHQEKINHNEIDKLDTTEVSKHRKMRLLCCC